MKNKKLKIETEYFYSIGLWIGYADGELLIVLPVIAFKFYFQ